MEINIGLIDDHGITRSGIRALLENNKTYRIIIEEANGEALLAKLKVGIVPDILILDLSLPNMSGFEIIKEMAKVYPSIRILIFSFYQAEDVILNAIHLGACGFLPKSADPLLLLTAIKSIIDYGFYIPDQIKRKFGTIIRGRSSKGFQGKEVLTEKEVQFIKLACTNLNYKEISVKLSVQPKTIENYRDSIFQKLGINNRAALTFYAIENGIVQLF